MSDDLIQEYEDFYLQSPDRWDADDTTICHLIGRYRPEPGRILDVGCGNGHTLAAMATVFPQAELYGLDLSKEALRLAAEKVPAGVFAQGFVEHYRPGVCFDVITMVGVAEHFIDIAAGLRAAGGLLCEDGIVYVEAPNNLSYSPGPLGYRRLESGSRQLEWHLPRGEWEQLIGSAGFNIQESGHGNSVVNEFVWILALR